MHPCNFDYYLDSTLLLQMYIVMYIYVYILLFSGYMFVHGKNHLFIYTIAFNGICTNIDMVQKESEPCECLSENSQRGREGSNN
jgi:hypothetical protein